MDHLAIVYLLLARPPFDWRILCYQTQLEAINMTMTRPQIELYTRDSDKGMLYIYLPESACRPQAHSP